MIEQCRIYRDDLFKAHQQELEIIGPLLARLDTDPGNAELQNALYSMIRFYHYVVKEGESLYEISADFMLNIDTLASLNDIENPLFLSPGTVLVIPNLPGIFWIKDESMGLHGYLANSRRNSDISLSLIINVQGQQRNFQLFPGEHFSSAERLYFTSRPFRSPLYYYQVGSDYGYRIDPFTGRDAFHSGLDLNVPMGTEIFSIGDGIIKETGQLENYGIYTIIEHEGGYESLYGHLNRALGHPGERVEQGDTIALSGNTGRSTGPHLHLEIRKDGQTVNPAALIEAP